jgi:hypothetical protein
MLAAVPQILNFIIDGDREQKNLVSLELQLLK